MNVYFLTLNGRHLSMNCTVPQFIDGPVMSHLAALQNNCNPTELVRDFLPAGCEDADDAELSQVFGEACMQATQYEPPGYLDDAISFREITGIEVEAEDLPYVREHVLDDTLVFGVEPQPAA